MIAALFIFPRPIFVGIGFVCFFPFVVDTPDPMLVSITVFVKIYVYSRDRLFTLHFSTVLPVVRVCSGRPALFEDTCSDQCCRIVGSKLYVPANLQVGCTRRAVFDFRRPLSVAAVPINLIRSTKSFFEKTRASYTPG